MERIGALGVSAWQCGPPDKEHREIPLQAMILRSFLVPLEWQFFGRLDQSQTQSKANSMSRAIIKIKGARFVLIPEAEFEAIEEASLPPLPPVFPDGTREAQPLICASIARDIIKERRELGLTQAQLAKLVGIRRDTLARLESGQHKPNVRTIERIDAALKRKRGKKK